MQSSFSTKIIGEINQVDQVGNEDLVLQGFRII